MKRRLSIAVAAALAAGGFSMSTTHSAWAEDAADKAGRAVDNAADAVDNTAETAGNAAKGAADKVGEAVDNATGAARDDKSASDTSAAAKPMFPAGIKAKDKPGDEDRMGVLKTLDTVTQAAFTKDGFDDLIERLVDQDRNRLGKDGYTEKKFDDLNAKVEAFQVAWKAKYGSDFKVEGTDALAKVMTSVGEVEDPAAVARAWPVAANAEAAGEAVTAAAKDPASTPGTTDRDIDANIEKGRDVAIAAVPASHGLPGVNVSLIQEAGGYRIDIPNTTTPQQLHDNLLKHMSHVLDMQSKWPADAKDAQAAVTHHVLLGIYGIEADKADGSSRDRDRGTGAGTGAGTDATGRKASDGTGTGTGTGAADRKASEGIDADD